MSKRKKFMEAPRKAETDFIREMQRIESSLQAEQLEEMAKVFSFFLCFPFHCFFIFIMNVCLGLIFKIGA